MRTRRRVINTALTATLTVLAAGWLYAETSSYAQLRGAVMHDIYCPEHGFRTMG